MKHPNRLPDEPAVPWKDWRKTDEYVEKRQVFGIDFGTEKVFKMLLWVFGIYEFQLNRMDREFCELSEDKFPVFGDQFFKHSFQLMQAVPVASTIEGRHETIPSQQVARILGKGRSFAVADCLCKKEKNMLEKGCDKPMEVCLVIAPVSGVFDHDPWGSPISKEDAFQVLKKTEDASLVHHTWNMQSGQFFICNCCGCCCGVFKGINEMGLTPYRVVDAYFFAEIDSDACLFCGVCAEDRCQVSAVEETGGAFNIDPEKCIGCGLCLSTCPTGAVSLVKRPPDRCVTPPANETEWYEERGRSRDVDFGAYR